MIFSCFSFAQDVEFEKKRIVSNKAFGKILNEDFNFLIFNSFTPKSGASISYKDEDAKLQLSGNLYNKNSSVVNISIETTANDGIYFFDDDGGTNAAINLNFFRYTFPVYNYGKPSKSKRLAFESYVIAHFEKLKQELVDVNEIANNVKKIKAKNQSKDYSTVNDTLIADLIKRSDSSINILTKWSRTFINNQDHLAYNAIITTPNLKKYDVQTKSSKVRQLKTEDIAKDLEKIRKEVLQLSDTIVKIGKEYAKEEWTVKRSFFYSAHAFYGRESFLEYDQNGMQAFSKRFDTQRGNLYGAVIYPLNFFYENLKGRWYGLPVGKLIFRSYVGGRRLSNRASFKNTEISGEVDLGTDNAGNTITGTITKNAYLGDTSYEYGNGINFGAELYYYPTKYDVGIFSRIGHEFQTYASGTEIRNKEVTPFRLGFLFGIDNDAKTSYTVQIFIDRTDFSLSPNGKDDDLRVGFGLGIPVNF
jgi:hypothetical protein